MKIFDYKIGDRVRIADYFKLAIMGDNTGVVVFSGFSSRHGCHIVTVVTDKGANLNCNVHEDVTLMEGAPKS